MTTDGTTGSSGVPGEETLISGERGGGSGGFGAAPALNPAAASSVQILSCRAVRLKDFIGGRKPRGVEI